MKKAFTLIETIVVVAVIGITLPVLFAIILILIRQQVKIYRLSQIKREGDYVIGVMENTIKDRAVTIHSASPASDANIVCKDALSLYSSTSGLYFLDKDKQWFGYLYDGSSKIASKSADLINPSIDLNSSKILVDSFSVSCSRNSVFSSASISLSFNICYSTGLPNCTTTRPEELTSMHYQTIIKLRNY